MRKRRKDLGIPQGGGWLLAFVCIMLIFWIMWFNEASAAGRTVYLVDEQDLENGMKHCIYTEGVIITIQAHRLCPISIEV